MCDPMSAAFIVATIAQGVQANDTSRKQQHGIQDAKREQEQNAILAEKNRPQAAKTPDQGVFKAANAQAAAAGGPSSTLLTGTSGVNPTSLTLGKNTLLGM